MAKTAAERQRECRRRLKEAGRYDAYKYKQAAQKQANRLMKKRKLTLQQKSDACTYERERKRKYMARKKTGAGDAVPGNSALAMRKSSLYRSVNKAKQGLPTSPRKRKLVVRVLAKQFSPEIVKSPEKRQRVDQAIDDVVRKHVEDFYSMDYISVQALGKKDFKIVRKNGVKEKIQKRYMSMTLNEAYQLFKTEFPMEKIGLSKFCEFRPAHISLRQDTPKNVCLCIYHENMRLILNAIQSLPNSTSEFCKLIVCNEQDPKCMFQNECDNCKDLKKFDTLVESLGAEVTSEIPIVFQQWIKNEENKLLRATRVAESESES